MTTQHRGDQGIKLLVSQYRKQFRIEENTDFYSKDDLEAAEKKFIKFAIRTGWQMSADSPSAEENSPRTDSKVGQPASKD